MSKNILSNKIRIFPSSSREASTNQFGTNFVTEYNLSSIVNKLISPGTSGFLISTTISSGLSNTRAEFNIGGYFVEVDSWQEVIDAALGTGSSNETNYQNFVTFSSDGKNVYAEAELEIGDEEEDVSYSRMIGSDSVTESSERKLSPNASPSTKLKLKLLDVSTYKTSDSQAYGGKYYSLSKQSRIRLVNFTLDDGAL